MASPLPAFLIDQTGRGCDMRQRGKSLSRTVRAAFRGVRSRGLASLFTLALVAMFFNFTAGRLFALKPGTLISQYGHTAWRVQDGALSGNPTSITQTPDGYIWVGTQGGLYQFDGVTFKAWTPPSGQSNPLEHTSIQSLYAAKDGSLWVGYVGLSHLVNGSAKPVSVSLAEVNAIAEDRNGSTWITRSHQTSLTGPLCKISGDGEQCYGKPQGIQTQGAGPIAIDAEGRLWIGAAGTLIEWDGKLIGEYELPAVKRTDEGRLIEGIATDADGKIWVGVGGSGRGSGLLQFVHGKWRTYQTKTFDGSNINVFSLFLDRNHCLWVGTANQGLYRIHDGSVEHFGHEDGLSADSVYEIFQDREGDMWVGTGEGVDHFRDLPIVTYVNIKSQGYVTSVLARHDGSIAVGTTLSLVSIRGSTATPQKASPSLPSNLGYSMLEDHLGNLWIGTSDGALLAQVNGRLRTVLKSDSTGGFNSLIEDVDHAIWAEFVGSHPRLIRIEDFEVREKFEQPQVPAAYCVIADPHGGIWVGFYDGSLRHYQKGRWQTLSTDVQVRKYRAIFNLSIDSEGTLWGAASGGVVGYRDGNLQLLTERNGLPCAGAYSTITDLQGNLWVQERCGLVRIGHSELERWWANPESKLTASTFAAIDGFRPGLPYGRPAATRSRDGKLWFHNGSAVMMIDPGNLLPNTVVPPVHVEQVVADRKVYPAAGELRLAARTRELELDYSGLSFVVPSKVLFRYMLEGYDKQWQEPGTRRAAFYNDLRPGKYTFRVMACNNSGLWNTVGASLQFTILPAYYQTNWFLALCGLAALALLWGIYQLRLRRLQQEFAIGLEARVNERTRIARELHDTLLQSFNALLLRLQTVSNVLPVQPNEAKMRIDRAIEQASNAVTEGRDKVHELRSGGFGTAELERSLSDFAGEVLSGSTSEPLPTVHVRVEGTPRPLDPVVRDEAYRIAAESMRNAIRHAQPRRIEVEIRYDERQLRLRIRDDGAGIDPAILESEHKAGHWGLRGMRERAKLVGGNLELWSQVGTGTEVELNIPAESAYSRSAVRRWAAFFRFRRV